MTENSNQLRPQRSYIFVEAAIGIGFVYLAFGGMARIATRDVIPDASPQSFMTLGSAR